MKEKRASQPGALFFFCVPFNILLLTQTIPLLCDTEEGDYMCQSKIRSPVKYADQIRKYFSIKSAASIYIPIVIFSLLPAAKLMST